MFTRIAETMFGTQIKTHLHLHLHFQIWEYGDLGALEGLNIGHLILGENRVVRWKNFRNRIRVMLPDVQRIVSSLRRVYNIKSTDTNKITWLINECIVNAMHLIVNHLFNQTITPSDPLHNGFGGIK